MLGGRQLEGRPATLLLQSLKPREVSTRPSTVWKRRQDLECNFRIECLGNVVSFKVRIFLLESEPDIRVFPEPGVESSPEDLLEVSFGHPDPAALGLVLAK